MRLKRLKLSNIRSYKEEEINFSEGSTLLCGDVGSGKTSILLAIEFALFGLQPGQRGSSLLANGKSEGSVELEFLVDGKSVVLERKLKRGSKSITQDYASITIDGMKLESSVTEIKSKVLELLNYPLEFIKKNNLLFRYTVYTPQEEMKQIILEDAESRMNILRHVFGIDKYKRIKENNSIITTKLRERSRMLQFEVKSLDENKEKLETNKKYFAILREKINSKNLDLEKAISERRVSQEEIEKLSEKIKEKDNFLKEIEKSNIMISNKVENLSSREREIKEFQEKVSAHKGEFSEQDLKGLLEEISLSKITTDEINKKYIECAGKMTSSTIMRKEESEKKERIFKIDMCPTCLQDVSENHKHNILNASEKRILEAEKLEHTLSEEIEKLKFLLNSEKIKLSDLENKKSNLEVLKVREENIKFSKEKLLDLGKLKEVLEKDIELLEKHIASLKQTSLEFTKFDNLHKMKEEELKELFRKEKNIEIELAEDRKELELTDKEILAISERIEILEVSKEKLIEVLDIEKWLSNEFIGIVDFIEKNIMITLRNEFSKLFNEWFSMLTTDAFYVHLDEKFTPVITQGDFELDYAFLSGGERTAVALAYRLALNQIINSLLSNIKTQGLVILDEPTDGFSGQQLDKVRDILNELKVNQLILVSHEPKIESFVDNVIRFKKEAGFSKKE